MRMHSYIKEKKVDVIKLYHNIRGSFMRQYFMKKMYVRVVVVLITSLSLFMDGSMCFAASTVGLSCKNDKRACWISFLDMETYLKDLDEQEFRLKVDEMYEHIANNNMNTVLVHVRAFGDAIYPSEYFPQAEYMTTYRKIPDYDPLAIMISMAHEKNLKFEAWVNPYRLSKNNETTISYKNTEFYDQYKDFIIEYTNSDGETALSLDPARPETVQLITNGVGEILENYDVDGIHFDDYFYMPGMADSLDTETKKLYVNQMVSSVYQTVKQYDEDCQFGISPAGNTDSARSQGADIDTWLSVPGYVDYIMPQIYWSDEYMIDGGVVTLYSDRCREWQSINALDIPIYVGLALYRVGEESSVDLGWAHSDQNLESQYRIACELGYDGYALFRYAWLEDSVAVGELSALSDYVGTIPDGFENVRKDEKDNEIKPDIYYYEPDSFVSYSVCDAINGWQPAETDGTFRGDGAGTIQGIRISLGTRAGVGAIRYRTYVDGSGWQNWSENGVANGNGADIRAVQIVLDETMCADYDVFYRVYYDKTGWLTWTRNGGTGGILEYKAPIRKIQILLLPQGEFINCYNYSINMW